MIWIWIYFGVMKVLDDTTPGWVNYYWDVVGLFPRGQPHYRLNIWHSPLVFRAEKILWDER